MASLDGMALLRRIISIRRQRRQGAEHVAGLAKARLAKVIAEAMKAPLYAERLEGLDPLSARLGDLPVLKKDEHQARLDEGFTAQGPQAKTIRRFTRLPENVGRLYLNKYYLAHTSGSQAARAHFMQDSQGWLIGQALMAAGALHWLGGLRGFLRRMPAPPWRVALAVPINRHFISMMVAAHTTRAWDMVSRTRYLDILDPEGRVAAALNLEPPHWLHSYPSMLGALAQARLAGSLQAEPRLITASSEPFTPATRSLVKKAWPQALVGETYSATEATPLAFTCPMDRLHLNADWFMIEPVDARGRAVQPGTMGKKMYLTHLFNRVQPLLRYEMEDRVRILAEPCLCGSPLPVLELGGRADDDLVLPRKGRGRATLPPIPLITALEDCPAAERLQVVQTGPKEVTVRFTLARGADQDWAAAELQMALIRHLRRNRASEAIEITVTRVNEIKRDKKTRKLRQVIRLEEG